MGFCLGLFGLHPIRDAVRKFNGQADESPNTDTLVKQLQLCDSLSLSHVVLSLFFSRCFSHAVSAISGSSSCCSVSCRKRVSRRTSASRMAVSARSQAIHHLLVIYGYLLTDRLLVVYTQDTPALDWSVSDSVLALRCAEVGSSTFDPMLALSVCVGMLSAGKRLFACKFIRNLP